MTSIVGTPIVLVTPVGAIVALSVLLTRSVRAERALRASEALVRLVADRAPVMIVKVENGVDEFRKYLDRRAENASDAAGAANASGRRSRATENPSRMILTVCVGLEGRDGQNEHQRE